jgi:nitrite reductase/ring-hydroxylating ferredoxin subunit
MKENEPIVTMPDGRPAEEQPIWRKDFPIDWPEDELRARRDFTRFLMLTSLAFVVGQFWIVLLRVFRKARGLPPITEIASLDELPVESSRLFEYPGPGNACLLVRFSKTEFAAFGQKCTHLSCPVIPDAASGRGHCPCHEGSFDLRSGRPLAGPPRRPLPQVTLEIRDGRIYATAIAEGIV